jgi:hypothetical protein
VEAAHAAIPLITFYHGVSYVAKENQVENLPIYGQRRPECLRDFRSTIRKLTLSIEHYS